MATERRTAEEVWRELRPHLEWAAGFSLIFLYAGHPRPLAALRERLSDSLQLRTLRLQVLSPKSPEELKDLAQAIVAARPGPGAGPLWVELWAYGSDPEWRSARTRLLHHLNERRFLLERDVRRPVVLVLPQEDRGRIYTEARRLISAPFGPTPPSCTRPKP